MGGAGGGGSMNAGARDAEPSDTEPPDAERPDGEPKRTDPARFPCPGCGAVLPYASPRYPKRFCPACLDTAADAEGRALEFAEASMSGGLWWRRRGDAGRHEDWHEDWHEETHDLVLCTVRGVPAMVREARLGGIAAEPIGPDFERRGRDAFGRALRIADLLADRRPGARARGKGDRSRS